MAKRKYTIRNPEAWAAKQQKAVEAATQKRLQTPERFWARVQKSDGCWLWTGPQSDKGYGRTSINGTIWGAHRYAWVDANGPITDGLFVLHRCDNPLCVRPDHLFLGTHSENMRDAVAKGRHRNGRLGKLAPIA